jgi:hypothetical protein
MLLVFSSLWSLFVVTQHSYGGDGRVFQILGTVAFFGVYLLPVSIVFALLLVWPAELIVRRLDRPRQRHVMRIMAWFFAAAPAYLGIPATSNSEVALSALVCAALAALAAVIVCSCIAHAPNSDALKPSSTIIQ